MKTVNIDLSEDDASTVYGLSSGDEVVIDEDAPVGAGPVLDADVVNEDVDPDDALPSHARPNVNGSVTLPLKYQRTVRSQKNGKIRDHVFTELVLHRLTGADINAFNATSEEKQTVVLLSRSTRLSHAVMSALFDKMDGADIAHAMQVIGHFLPSGRKTGRK